MWDLKTDMGAARDCTTMDSAMGKETAGTLELRGGAL